VAIPPTNEIRVGILATFLMKDNELIIGKKEISTYLRAGEMLLEKNEVVTVKARGSTIPRAITVVEIFKRQNKATTTDIRIGTDVFKTGDRTSNVSSIEIDIER